MNRRSILKNTLAGTGAVALSGCVWPGRVAEGSRKPAVLRLCSQEGRIPGNSLKEKVANLQRYGCAGIEFGGNPASRVAEIKATLKGTGLKVAALCWGSQKGDLVSLDMEKRKSGIAALKATLNTAAELESTGVIYVPCFHKQSELKPAELDKILFDIFPAIGDYAKKVGSRILIEPLNKKETFYINRLEQAAAICNKLNNEGICMMGDFYHMALEESDQTQAFVTGGKWVHHVHLATRDHRILPAQEPHSYVEGFKGLKLIGYQDFCSLECGCKKGTNPEVEVPRAFDYLRKQWDEAKI